MEANGLSLQTINNTRPTNAIQKTQIAPFFYKSNQTSQQHKTQKNTHRKTNRQTARAEGFPHHPSLGPTMIRQAMRYYNATVHFFQ
jgi:hypothetical protein